MTEEFQLVNRGVRIARSGVFHQPDRNFSVLLLNLAHLGDLILALPAILRLKDKIKNCDLDIVVGDYNVDLAKSFNIFRNVYVYNFFEAKSSKAPARSAEKEEMLLERLAPYDIAIDLRRPPDTRFLLFKVEATMRVGFTTFSQLDEQLDVCMATDDSNYEFGKAKAHNLSSISLQLLQLIDPIPIRSIPLPQLGADVTPENSVGIFPFAGQELKEWPADRFLELTAQILADRLFDRVNVYVSGNEIERASGFSKIRGAELNVGLGIQKLVLSLKTNGVVIANNSFGAHFASLLNIPVIGIYGGHETFIEWQPPFGENKIIYSDLNCSPCHLAHQSQCPFNLLCLGQITVNDVLKVLHEYKHIQRPMAMRHFNYVSTDIAWDGK